MDRNKLAEGYSKQPLTSYEKLQIQSQSTELEKYQTFQKLAFLAGFDAAMTELSKSGEFREFWIRWFENWNDRTHVITDVMTEKSKHGEDIHVIDIQALAAANAKLAEKDARIQELADLINKKAEAAKEAFTLISDKSIERITELEQQLKDHRESLRKSVNRSADLSEQLKKAESVIEFYGKQDNWCLNGYKAGSLLKGSLKDSEEVNDNETLNHIGGKLARQYLKSRGE